MRTIDFTPIFRNSVGFDRLQNVLEHVEDFLHDECGESLDKAISLLDVLQEQFGRVF